MAQNEIDEQALAAQGSFVGREAEQERWREMLKDIQSGKKGFFGSLLGGSSKQTELTETIKSRVVLISGQEGVGKTRLSLKLRDIANRDKIFKGKFRVSQLDWLEAAERDRRLAVLPFNQPVPPDLALDILHSHFMRDDFELSFEVYQKAIADTEKLAKTVQGAELKAVWEFRARAMGEGIYQASQDDKPLVFIIENFGRLVGLEWLVRLMMEESGSLVTWVLVGAEDEPFWQSDVAPERFINFRVEPLTEAELLQFLTNEIARYSDVLLEDDAGTAVAAPKPDYRSPAKISLLQQASGGLPLAARMEAYLLQIGATAEELELSAAPIEALLLQILEESFAGNHPDRLKVFSLGVLRRSEPGLMTAMLSLRADYLPINDLLKQMRGRYTYLFEPGQNFRLHSAIAPVLQKWLWEAEQRNEEIGTPKLVRRALDYLTERLRDWGQTFNSLQNRIADLKWSDWAIDLVWFNFWLSTEDGWREATPILIAGMEYKPIVAEQMLVTLSRLVQLGALAPNEVALLQGLPTNDRPAWQTLQKLGIQYNWFDKRFPQYTDEFERIVSKHL